MYELRLIHNNAQIISLLVKVLGSSYTAEEKQKEATGIRLAK